MMYHSALKTHKQVKVKPVQSFTHKKVHCFVHDFEKNGYINTYDSGDFIYAEIPWLHGYNEFNKRAGKFETGKWQEMLERAVLIAKRFRKPVFYTGGKQMLKHFKSASQVTTIRFSEHKIDCLLFCFNFTGEIKSKDTNDLMNELYQKYNVGIDISCGYGNLVRAAIKNDKWVIASDINASCIGYIKQNIENWYENL